MERKLTAILCADVHGYSRLMGDDEEATLRTLSACRKITDSLIERHHGRFVNSAGDSVLAEFASVVTHTADSLVALMRSRSYYITAPPERQREIETGIRELVATHPDLRGRATFDLPYVTRAYRSARR